MRRRIKRHIFSFRYAFEGLVYTWKNEPNFNIHIILSVIAIILGLLLKISSTELLIILLTITIGLSAELANTSIEKLTDFVTEEHHKQAKIVKDVAASMVLVVAIGSVLIAFVIFTPYLLPLLK